MPLETPLLWGCPKGHRYPKGTGSAFPATLNLPPVLCFSRLFGGSYPNKSGQLYSRIFDGAPPLFLRWNTCRVSLIQEKLSFPFWKYFFHFFLEWGAGEKGGGGGGQIFLFWTFAGPSSLLTFSAAVIFFFYCRHLGLQPGHFRLQSFIYCRKFAPRYRHFRLQS